MTIHPFSPRACRAASLAGALLMCASAAAAQTFTPPPSSQVNPLVGTWTLTLTSPNGTHPATATIREESGELSGSITGHAGTNPLTIKSSDAGLTLSFAIQYEGRPLPITMSGKVDGDTIKGSVDYGGEAAGDFTGSRAPAGSAAAGSLAAGSVAGDWSIRATGPDGTETNVWSMSLTQESSAVAGKLVNGESGDVFTVKGTLVDGVLALHRPDAGRDDRHRAEGHARSRCAQGHLLNGRRLRAMVRHAQAVKI